MIRSLAKAIRETADTSLGRPLSTRSASLRREEFAACVAVAPTPRLSPCALPNPFNIPPKMLLRPTVQIDIDGERKLRNSGRGMCACRGRGIGLGGEGEKDKDEK